MLLPANLLLSIISIPLIWIFVNASVIYFNTNSWLSGWTLSKFFAKANSKWLIESLLLYRGAKGVNSISEIFAPNKSKFAPLSNSKQAFLRFEKEKSHSSKIDLWKLHPCKSQFLNIALQQLALRKEAFTRFEFSKLIFSRYAKSKTALERSQFWKLAPFKLTM